MWDSVDLDSSSEGAVVAEAKLIIRRKLGSDLNGHPDRRDMINFTQHEINDIMDTFKQKPGEPLLS